jgi:tetratricopeptide (TPR) repeat protein
MARKKRRLEPVAATPTETGPKPRYKDSFQSTVGQRVEDAGKIFEGQGRNILYALGALLILGVVAWLIFSWSGSSNAKAQTALGKAIETSQAQILAEPPAGSTAKSFKTERERAEAAIAEFQAVVDNHGGSVGSKAKYFIAVNRLVIDKPAAVAELETLSKESGEVGYLSKFALAQAKTDEGKLDEAAALYSELAAAADPVVAKETINFELAKIYEKQGKKPEAIQILFDLVKKASEAKDLEGKAVPLNATARSAKDKLTELDPEKAKEIPEQPLDTGAGGLPF